MSRPFAEIARRKFATSITRIGDDRCRGLNGRFAAVKWHVCDIIRLVPRTRFAVNAPQERVDG